ncbi:MAG: N-acetyl-gamma-glutamyl-phosphate reductase [Gammaproteobacteria bacterium]|nr:N-acetyl-gamma-glutamyl-phosphate reductase [Gammaproteobacteria bacterium]
MQQRVSLALIGARGHTGAELLRLLTRHDGIEMVLASSGSQAGRALAEVIPHWQGRQRFVDLKPQQVAEVAAEVWVLAVPNGHSEPWVQAIAAAHPGALILDLGADYRFADDWTYGLTEWQRKALTATRRISNPGCYATAMQLGVLPLQQQLAATPVAFGVSGYSGAGSTPSPRNNPQRLADNLLPYALCGHVHEREVSHRLGQTVRFMPHVASWFRGISMTLAVTLREPTDADTLRAQFQACYADEALLVVQQEIPEVSQVRETCAALIGGFSVDQRDGRRCALVVVLDNLLKGAASQALQNINLALGLDELTGIRHD